MPQFVRRTWSRYAKLGKGRKKKQVWRRPTGRDNKMRERKRGLPATVKIGYGTDTSKKKEIKVVRNLKDLDTLGKNEVIVIGNIGKKKKLAIVEEVKKKGIKVQNENVERFLKTEKVRKEKKAGKKMEVKTGKENSKTKNEGENKK